MARDRQVEPAQRDTSELPDLTPMQMNFVKGILEGKTASDAYRASYSVENMSDEAIWVEASRVKSSPNVSLWLSRARQECLADTVITLEGHTRELLRLAQAAENAGNYGASVKATELTGRANGLYVDRIKTDDGKVDVLQALKTIAEQNQPLALALAQQMGLSESDILGADNHKPPVTH